MLILMDYASHYPEVVLLKGIQVQGVVQALLWFFSQVGIPREILSDRGATFTSFLLRQLCRLLGIFQLFTTLYHPQTHRLVECMNQTLKDLLCKTTGWDKFLYPLLFALRATTQAFQAKPRLS